VIKIGIDIDGVARDLVGRLIEVYKKHYGDLEIDYDDITEYGLHKFFPIGDYIYDFMWLEHVDEVVAQAPAIRGIRRFIGDLRELHDDDIKVFLVSHQPPTAFLPTAQWIEQHRLFREVDGVILLKGGLAKSIEKSEFDLDILIDDSTENLKEFREHGGIAIAFAQPWNQDWDGPRYSSFDRIVEHIKTILKDLRKKKGETRNEDD